MCAKLTLETEGLSLAGKIWALRLLPFLFAVWLYQKLLSPILPPLCRYYPSCSEYTFQAIRQRGVIQGIFIGGLRILRCAPWGGSGYDPVEAFRWPWQGKGKPADADSGTDE